MIRSAPAARRSGECLFAASEAETKRRFGGSALTVESHSSSARPIRPTLIPVEVVRRCVGWQLPRRLPSGSKTLARSQGKSHWADRCWN